MVLVETKLSQNTGLTTGQTLAQQQAGKGSLFYKPTNAKKKQTLMTFFCQKKLNKGQE